MIGVGPLNIGESAPESASIGIGFADAITKSAIGGCFEVGEVG
jgi:hypothetical protein